MSGDVRLHRWRLRFEPFGPHRIARPLRDGIVSVFGPLPLRRHATVPFDFRRRVSRWPRGHVFQTPPFCERDPAPGDVAQSSSGGDLHPSALSEPDVRLSPHPAPTLQPPAWNRKRPCLRHRLLPSLVGRPPRPECRVPSLRRRYPASTVLRTRPP